MSNAGAFLLRTLEATNAADLDETQLSVNIRAPFYVAQAFLPAMRDVGKGSFITLGSVADHTGLVAVWDPVDPDRREGLIDRADMLRPADVAEAIIFIATRPAHVLIDWLRLGPVGNA